MAEHRPNEEILMAHCINQNQFVTMNPMPYFV